MPDDTPTLPPGAAAKVLTADLRNTVAKVAAGERLPEADRARLEATVLAEADPDAVARLAKERVANLLKIWSSGRRRLTPSELTELEPVLPRAVLAKPPTKKSEYQHALAHYVPIYDAAERTLKDWCSIGRAAQPAPDMPPLDDPPRMKDWYARNKKNRVPARLLIIAAEAARLEKSSAAKDEPPASVEPSAAPKEPDTCPDAKPAASPKLPAAPVSAIASGYLATLDRLRNAEAAAGERYTRLVLTPDSESAAEQARRSWESLTKQLRAYEKDAEEVLQKSGQSWVAAEAIAAIHEVHVPLRDSILTLYDRIDAKLETLSRAERRRYYREEVGRIFATLVANRFTASA